jgi:RNAse (barnase) inhibitor barstar
VKTIVLDGHRFSDLEGFYSEMDSILTKDLEWKTGHNMDAFSDLLYGGFGVHAYEEPLKIIWTNSSKSKEDLGFDETIKYFTAKLKNCHPSFIENINTELEQASQHQGKTLFHLIVDIIRQHAHIKLSIT